MTALRTLFAGGIAATIAAAVAAPAVAPVPPLEGHVTDTAGALDPARRAQLERKLADFETRKGAQLAVLVVPSTAPETIDQFGIRVAERWRLGRQGVDDGAILLVAMQDRAVRIEVGYGLEGVLTDARAHRILADDVEPRFRAGDVAGGLEAGTDRMMAIVGEEPLPRPDGEGGSTLLFPLMLFVMGVAGMLRRLLGPLPAATLAGSAAGVAAWWIAGSLLLAVGLAIVTMLVTVSGIAAWLPFAGRGNGGGRFGGRGGGFGGGGASGRW